LQYRLCDEATDACLRASATGGICLGQLVPGDDFRSARASSDAAPTRKRQRSENSEMLAQIDAVALERGGGRDHGNAAAVENDDVIGDIEY